MVNPANPTRRSCRPQWRPEQLCRGLFGGWIGLTARFLTVGENTLADQNCRRSAFDTQVIEFVNLGYLPCVDRMSANDANDRAGHLPGRIPALQRTPDLILADRICCHGLVA